MEDVRRAGEPHGATLEDGYRVALISEAMEASARAGCRIDIEPELSRTIAR
jgi:hypothetical protein